MSEKSATDGGRRVFGLDDWNAWLDAMATRLFGMSGREFEIAYRQGALAQRASAHDLASVIPLIESLRRARERG